MLCRRTAPLWRNPGLLPVMTGRRRGFRTVVFPCRRGTVGAAAASCPSEGKTSVVKVLYDAKLQYIFYKINK